MTLWTETGRREELARQGHEQILERFSQDSLSDAFYKAIENHRTDRRELPDL